MKSQPKVLAVVDIHFLCFRHFDTSDFMMMIVQGDQKQHIHELQGASGFSLEVDVQNATEICICFDKWLMIPVFCIDVLFICLWLCTKNINVWKEEICCTRFSRYLLSSCSSWDGLINYSSIPPDQNGNAGY